MSMQMTGTAEQRAHFWIVNGWVGASSKSIWAHMMGIERRDGFDYPLDPDDLNRCLLLLDLIPEWKPRMKEMAVHGPAWEGLAGRWGEISECFLDEVGLNWAKGRRAPKTYAMMQCAQRGAV